MPSPLRYGILCLLKPSTTEPAPAASGQSSATHLECIPFEGTTPFPARFLEAISEIPENAATHVVTGWLPADSRCTPMVDPPAGLLAAAEAAPAALITGRATGNSNANDAERLLLRLETGVDFHDLRRAYRVYPLDPLRRLVRMRRDCGDAGDWRPVVHLAWGGVPVRTAPIPEEAEASVANTEKRSFCRDLLLHGQFLMRRLWPWPHPRLIDAPPPAMPSLRHPLRLIRGLLSEHASPRDLAVSGFVGVFLGALPLVAAHTVSILYVTTRLRLNRVLACLAQNICAPPIVPVLCVEIGHYLRYGRWLVEASRDTLLLQLHQRLFEWLIGSLLLGPVLGLFTAILIYAIARIAGRSSAKAERA